MRYYVNSNNKLRFNFYAENGTVTEIDTDFYPRDIIGKTIEEAKVLICLRNPSARITPVTEQNRARLPRP